MEPEEKLEDMPNEESEPMAAEHVCINHNSAGSTCDHYEREHGGPGGGCQLCDCDSFIPSA